MLSECFKHHSIDALERCHLLAALVSSLSFPPCVFRFKFKFPRQNSPDFFSPIPYLSFPQPPAALCSAWPFLNNKRTHPTSAPSPTKTAPPIPLLFNRFSVALPAPSLLGKIPTLAGQAICIDPDFDLLCLLLPPKPQTFLSVKP